MAGSAGGDLGHLFLTFGVACFYRANQSINQLFKCLISLSADSKTHHPVVRHKFSGINSQGIRHIPSCTLYNGISLLAEILKI